MYLDKVLKDEINSVNINSILHLSHEIILNTKDYFLIYLPEIEHYYTDCDNTSGKLNELCNKIKQLNYKLVCTTNEKIAKGLNSKHSTGYLQFVYNGEEIKESESKLILLKDEDLNYVKETYKRGDYIEKLQKMKRIWGYYKNNILIGYIMEHLNGSTGGLFIKPEFRNKGYGTMLLKEGYSKVKKWERFSQVALDNKESIRVHEKLKSIKCDVIVYYNFNK